MRPLKSLLIRHVFVCLMLLVGLNFEFPTTTAQAMDKLNLNPFSHTSSQKASKKAEKAQAKAQKQAEKEAEKKKAEEAKATEKKAKQTEKENKKASHPHAKSTDGALIQTERGNIVVELYPEEAPVTVKNFVELVKDGFYNTPNMKFHRVVPGFVIQTGDPTGTGYGGSKKKIPLEAKNHLIHDTKGVMAMARGPSPDSASSQFYITLAKQPTLDGKYAVFGHVISGMDVLDKIQPNDRVYGISMIDTSTVKSETPEEKKSVTDKAINFLMGKP